MRRRPVATTRTSASQFRPSSAVTVQRPAASSHAQWVTFVRGTTRSAAPYSRATSSRYSRISDWGQQGRDQPGRTFSGQGTGARSAYSETNFHDLEEARFAADTADMLRQRALRGDFDSLIIVAPPKTLGELRKHYHKEVEQRLIGEIAKDLTNHPVSEIEKIIAAA